jgi:hypothetical protein
VKSETLTMVTMKSSVFWDAIFLHSGSSLLMFQRNILAPSSESKNKPSKQQTGCLAYCMLLANHLHGLLLTIQP